MATNASFNLSKTAKKLIATGKDKAHRAVLRKMFINAEASFIANKTRRPRDNNNQASKEE